MRTFLLTWNPSAWAWTDFEEYRLRNLRGERAELDWSTGNRRDISAGERVFLLRQESDRGIIASGYTLNNGHQAPHWNSEREGDANYVKAEADCILSVADVLPTEILLEAIPEVAWNRLQASGIEVPPVAAARLETLWAEHRTKIYRRAVPFVVGQTYTRKDVYRLLEVPSEQQGGDWDTGSHRHGNDWFVFCTVGDAGRTGHDYANHWIGDELVWYGRTGSQLDHPRIQSMIKPAGNVLIFTREDNRAPFNFEGLAKAIRTEPTVPVTIHWRFPDRLGNSPTSGIPGEIAFPSLYREGAVQLVTVNAYERNRQARDACIARFGARCRVCGFVFAATYGSIGENFIHVHHLRELASVGHEYQIDPITDLRPVCANCHAMLHTRQPARSIEELQQMMRAQNPDFRPPHD